MRRAILGMILILAVGCSKTSTTPTGTNPEPYSGLDFFTGTLSPGGTQLHAFNVLVNVSMTVTLASVRPAGTSTTLSTPLKVVLGTPNTDTTACTPLSGTNTTLTVAPALTGQISQSMTPGVYCVSVADAGGLSGDVDFAVRIYQYSGNVVSGQAATDRFSSNLYPGGRVTRTLSTGAIGDIKVGLTNVEPGASLGIGVGLTTNNSDCHFTKSIVTTAGAPAELSVNADPGTYCLAIYDPGTLPGRVTFFMDVVHQ